MAAARSMLPVAIRPQPDAVRRALIAGTAWGVPMAGYFVTMSAWRCGSVCPTDAAITLVLCVAAGIPTIGLFAALTGRPATTAAKPRAI